MTSDGLKEAAWLTAQVTPELYKALKALADEHDRSLSAEVRQAVRAHIDAHAHSPDGAAA